MAAKIITNDGDLVDAVVWRETGRRTGAFERVLDANPHLAKQQTVLPAGVTIVIPDDAAAAPPRPVFKLWD